MERTPGERPRSLLQMPLAAIFDRRVFGPEDLRRFRSWQHRLNELFIFCASVGYALLVYGGVLLVPAWAGALWLLVSSAALLMARFDPNVTREFLVSSALVILSVLGWVALTAAPLSSLVSFCALVILTGVIITQSPRVGFYTLVLTLTALYVIRAAQTAFSLDPGLSPSPKAWLEAGQVGIIFVVHYLLVTYLSNLICLLLEENREANQSLMNSEAARTVFLASVTHELRTPLTGIRGYVDLMLAEKLPGTEGLQVVRRNAARLENLIDELLNVADPMSLAARMKRVRVNLSEVVRQEAEALNGGPATKPRAPVLASTEGDVWVLADRTRMEQVVVNLLVNAVEHSPSDRPVHIRLALRGNEAVVEVADSGAGIAPGTLERVYDPLFSSPSSVSDRRGMGLGLTICRQIVEASEGTIVIASAEGVGTTVTVSLPALAPAPPRTALRRPAGVPRVLVLDDDHDVCALMRETLRVFGCEYEIASDGKQALDLALTQDFELYLLDINVPSLPGTEVARRLRAAGRPGKVFLFSAIPPRTAERAIAEAGADGFIPKPFNMDDLAQQLRLAGFRLTL